MIFFLAIAIAIAFALLGGFLYFDLSNRMGEIEAADDAPHALVKQVQESRIENHDNRDEIRRQGERIDRLESRKLTVSESGPRT